MQLIEYTNAELSDERWAEWIVDESRDEIVSAFQRWCLTRCLWWILPHLFAYAWLSPSNRHAQYIGFIQLENGDVPELEDRKNEAEWNETTIESDNLNSHVVTSPRPSSSGCSSFPAEAGPENGTFHVFSLPKTYDHLSATGNLSLFGIQGPADCAIVSRNGELQTEHECSWPRAGRQHSSSILVGQHCGDRMTRIVGNSGREIWWLVPLYHYDILYDWSTMGNLNSDVEFDSSSWVFFY